MKQRYVFLDYTRLVAAYLVVLGHLLPISGNPVKSFIYTFHISLFFLISGMLHSYNGHIQIKKYVKAILVPALFFFFFVGALLCVFAYCSFFQMDYSDYYGIIKPNNYISAISFAFWYDLKNLILGNMVINGPCWFLFALFFMKCIADICLKNNRALVACILFSFLLVAISKEIINPFSIGRALFGLPFYLIGYYYKNSFIEISRYKNSILLSFMCFLCVLICLYFNHQPSYTALEYGVLPFPLNTLVFYIGGISGTIMVMLLCSKWQSGKYVEYVVNSLITILGVQALFFKPFIAMFGRDLNIGIHLLIAVIITLLCCIVHSLLLNISPILIGKK